MLPSRPTLRAWNPDGLASSAALIEVGASSVFKALHDLDDECVSMSEGQAWSGRSHDAASAMFGRATVDGSKFLEYANGVAAVLKHGSSGIGAARTMLLNHADQLDEGPLNLSDQWVVQIDSVRVSADEFANLLKLAHAEQAVINGMLLTVGDADGATANAVVAVGDGFGFVEATPSDSDPGSLLVPPPNRNRPPDEVPNPRTSLGMLEQEALRNGDMSVEVREVTDSVNQHGEEVRTVFMQDGSKFVTTEHDPFEWPSKHNFISLEQFANDGTKLSETSSWRDMGTDSDITSITWPDGSNFTMSMDPDGNRNAGYTSSYGAHTTFPVELIDNISLYTGSAMSGLEKHIAGGGALPMLTSASVDSIGGATKFGGPALGVATTIFDIATAANGRDACTAAVAGAFGMGGGWGGAEAGAYLGGFTGGAAPVAIPVLATLGALGGGYWSANLGKAIGSVACPY
ncbi:MAG: hypothetical protein JWQ86_4184 [Mycobacterium sp.]|nr:hypothetical protein [Mycobacterium sp.]